MGQKDLTQKGLESYSDVFADVLNALLFKGKHIVKQEELLPAPTESIYNADGNNVRNQFQDVSMYVLQNGQTRLQYLLENQTKTERRHVLRKAGYQGAIYRKQYDSKNLYPVVGIVLYWGKAHWRSPLSLKKLLLSSGSAMYPMTEELGDFWDDIKLHVYEMAHLSAEVRGRFRSDMRVIVDYLAEGKNYQPTDQKLIHVEAFLRMLRALTGDIRYEQLVNEFQDREEIGMCELLDKYESIGMEKGMDITLVKDLKSLMQTMNLTLEKAMDALRVPEGRRSYYAELIQK